MTVTKTFLASAALSLLAGVNSHLVVTHPVPYDQASLDNSPLLADASNFPCKFGGGYTSTITTMNNMVAGESSNLTFMGSAVHGGGSCQVSVTLDKTPSKSSQWKVIHSIIGGCPADVPGNLDGPATNTAGLRTFDFTLPKGMPNGQYSMAWSWLNRIGNREFYMNCWPVTVTGGGSDTSVYDKLPDMFVANLPPTTCATPETFNFVYPDPGDSVETAATTITTFASTFVAGSSAGCPTVTALGAGSGSAGTPAQATGAASGSGSSPSSAPAGGVIGSAATSASPSSAATSNPGGVFAPGASSAAATTLATSAAASSAPAPTAAASSAVSAAPAAASSAAGSAAAPAASASAGQVACTAEGFYCIDATTFGMCANGVATPQAVADGTTCSDNSIDFAQKQVPAGTKNKRTVEKYARHFPHAHRHRRNALGYDF